MLNVKGRDDKVLGAGNGNLVTAGLVSLFLFSFGLRDPPLLHPLRLFLALLVDGQLGIILLLLGHPLLGRQAWGVGRGGLAMVALVAPPLLLLLVKVSLLRLGLEGQGGLTVTARKRGIFVGEVCGSVCFFIRTVMLLGSS